MIFKIDIFLYFTLYFTLNMPFTKREIPFTNEEYENMSKQLKNYYKNKRPDLLINVNEINIDTKINSNTVKKLIKQNKMLRIELLEAIDEIETLKLDLSAYY